jgi:hypothetical protein
MKEIIIAYEEVPQRGNEPFGGNSAIDADHLPKRKRTLIRHQSIELLPFM